MKTVAIISEYNPFHTGHKYQIDKIREQFGEQTRIIAIMSGNYVQRGEVAIMDKSVRSECAVRCGVNLVLELPFPFSMSSAEFFARGGVKIADSLGVVDYLSFGSECGDINLLTNVAKNMSSEKYASMLSEEISAVASKDFGYPQICESVYAKLYNNKNADKIFTPNNILAFEYIKALNLFKSEIKPHTIKRLGADYRSDKILDFSHQSASAIRSLMKSDADSALQYIPENIKNIVLNSFSNGQAPCDAEALSSAIISFLRLTPMPSYPDIQDAGGGLYNRLRNASFEANNIHSLTAIADTKKYTTSRIKRAIWYSYFGVTSSNLNELPLYTQVLAMDNVGKTILKEVKKMKSFPIITKPSSFGFLSDEAKLQKLMSDNADSVFQITKPNPPHGSFALLTTPYVAD